MCLRPNANGIFRIARSGEKVRRKISLAWFLSFYPMMHPLLQDNYGSVPVNSFLVTYNVDGVNTQTMVWTGTVNPAGSFTLGIPQITGLINGVHTFSANISAVSSGTDINLANNNNIQNFSIANVMNVSVTNATACANAPAVLSATGAVSYNWTAPGGAGAGTTSSITVTQPATSVYSVVVSNSACAVMRTATLFILPSPTLSVNSATNCAGVNATLTASGANSYSWSTGGLGAGISVSPTITSTYTATGTGTNGCTSSIVSTVSILPSPTLALSNMTICAGGTATMLASGANSYSWSTGSTAATITASPLSNTIYTVTGTVNACAHTSTLSVTIGTALSILISPATSSVCNGGSVTLSATGANTYTWNNGSNAAFIVVSPITQTTYSVAGHAGTCPGSGVATVSIYSLPSTTVTSIPVSCFGGSNGQLNATSSGAGPFAYVYSGGSTNLSAGQYTVTTTDAHGCQSSLNAVVSQPTGITGNYNSNLTSCRLACDGTATLSFNGGVAPYSHTVLPVNSNQTNLSALCAGVYSVLIRDNNNCVVAENFTVSSGNTPVTITSTLNHVSCAGCTNGTVIVNPTSGTGPYSYTWMPMNVNTKDLVNVGAGCYELTVDDNFGCRTVDTLCVTFDVGVRKSGSISGITILPNPSTGLFVIKGLLDNAHVSVYDAMGKQIIGKQVADAAMEIDLSTVAKGIYYARIRTNDQILVLKLVKQ